MRKWLSVKLSLIKEILWRPGVGLMLTLYGLLQAISNYITWFLPLGDQAKHQYVQLLTWRIWLIATPILTFILLFLIIRAALQVIAKRESEHVVAMEEFRKERLARLKEKDNAVALLTAEKVGLQSQLEVEKAKSNRAKIEGEIQEVLINETHHFGEEPGTYVTVKISIINSRFLPTKIKSFSLKMPVKGKIYESGKFLTGELYRSEKGDRRSKTEIKNLADVLNQPRGLEYNIAEEGFLRFYIPDLTPSSADSEEGMSEGVIFNLDDVGDVTLIVTDYSTDYTIVASGIKPQWADISHNWF